MNARRILLHSVTGLELACIAGVFWLGARILPAESARAEAPVPAAEPDADPATSFEPGLDANLDAGVAPDEERAFIATPPLDDGLASFHADRVPGRERD